MTAFEITDPCQEPWERMKPRAEGRYCERCERTVIDLSRMTRREAERRVRAATEDRICVQLALDPLDRPVFRPEPKRAPHWAGGLVLIAALTGGGCGTASSSEGEPVAQLEPEPCPVDGPPMQPVDDPVPAAVLAEAQVEDEMVTGPVAADALDTDEDATPTAEQRALTRRKQQRANIGVQRHIRHVRGGMAIRPSVTSTPTF